MNVKFLTLCCAGLITWAGLGQVAEAQQAAPPIGAWVGKDGPADVCLSVADNGSVMYYVSGAPPVVGRWTWSPTLTGGVITIHYQISGNAYRMYYEIGYIGGDRIQFSDPYISLILKRR